MTNEQKNQERTNEVLERIGLAGRIRNAEAKYKNQLEEKKIIEEIMNIGELEKMLPEKAILSGCVYLGDKEIILANFQSSDTMNISIPKGTEIFHLSLDGAERNLRITGSYQGKCFNFGYQYARKK